MIKLDNPFMPQPEPVVTFWAAKSEPMMKLRDFFETQSVTRGFWPSHALVGDVGSGKTRLMKYLVEKFKFDTTRVVCYVSLREVFMKLKEKHMKEIDIKYVETFHNEIYLQLEKLYQSVLSDSKATPSQTDFSKKVLEILHDTKTKVIGPRLSELATFEEMIKEINEKLAKADKEERGQLEKRKSALESAASSKLREELFTSDEFYSFLDTILKRLRKEMDIDVFILYVDELELIIEMERDYKIYLKSTTQTEFREHLVERLSPYGLKLVAACTSKIWVNFEPMFRTSFRPQQIPNLGADDLEEAIKEHLRRLKQEKYNPLRDPAARKFIAHYCYHNFRSCMAVLSYCYQEYIKQFENGNEKWVCDLTYVMKNHFDKSIKIEFYSSCIQVLERELPRDKRPVLDKLLKNILIRFEEFDYDSLWKDFRGCLEKNEFELLIETLRRLGAISQIAEDVYIVNRENFAKEEFERTPIERRVLEIFYELAGDRTQVDKVAFFKRLEEEKIPDTTRERVLDSLEDTLRVVGDGVLFFGARPDVVERIKDVIGGIRREPHKSRIDLEVKKLTPYILQEIWGWEIKNYEDWYNLWVVSTTYDPGTGGAIERKISGLVLFKDYRYEKPSEAILKGDILDLKRLLKKNPRLEFGIIICIHEPPLPDFLGLRAPEPEVEKCKTDPMLWKKLFATNPNVLGSENEIAKEGFDITWKEDKLKFSDSIFVYPVHVEETFPPNSKLEGERIVDYILALDRMPGTFGKEIDDIKSKYLDPSLSLLKSILANPVLLDLLLRSVLSRTWEIDLPIGMLRDESTWPQKPEKRKWVDNEQVLKLLDQIATTGSLKCNDDNRNLIVSLTTSGFFGQHGGKKVEEIYLKREVAVSGGKMVPKQFKDVLDAITDEPKDASAVFMTYLEASDPFRNEVPGEKLLNFNYQKLITNKTTRGLIESVDLAAYIMFKMFPDCILQARNTEDNRFTYKLLKEIMDPKGFIDNLNKLDGIITFLLNKGFKLDDERKELEDLLKIGKRVEEKLRKDLEVDAKQAMAEENESKLTGKKLGAQARFNELSTGVEGVLTIIKEAFSKFPTISEWLKSPCWEEWNEQTQSMKKENLLPLPDELKKKLETGIGEWLKSEAYTKEEKMKITKMWEDDIWPNIDSILSEDGKKVCTWIEGVKKQMELVRDISSVSEQFVKATVLKTGDYIKLLKPLRNLNKIVDALRIAIGYIEGGAGVVDYAMKDIGSYNGKVADACRELLIITRQEIERLDAIFANAAKIDACEKKVGEYQRVLARAKTKYYENYHEVINKMEAGIIDDREIKANVESLVIDLTINQLYGCLVLNALDAASRDELVKTFNESLIESKLVEYKRKLADIQKFCETYRVKFKDREFWRKRENECVQKYDLFVHTFIDGIWEGKETVNLDGVEIKDVTAFMQYVDSFNENAVKAIIVSIPKELDEPFSTILEQVKSAHEQREVFETVLRLIADKKIRRKPEEILKFLKDVEKFGLLW